MDRKDAKMDSNGTADRQPLMDFTARMPKAAFVAPNMRLVAFSPSDEMHVESDSIPQKDPLENDGGERMVENGLIVSV